MKVLIACEESQTICIAFRELGIEAYSCDIQICSGGHPEWHIMQDVLQLLNGNCSFYTLDGLHHTINGQWDLIIAHPCTYLSNAGNRWFNVDRYGIDALNRHYYREEAIKFFMYFVHANCNHICIENPAGVMSTRYRKPDQIIQPWMFGDPYEKRTCLWLLGLPLLKPTKIVNPPPRLIHKSGKTSASWYALAVSLSPDERSRVRSKTFPGVAKAIADQWSIF